MNFKYDSIELVNDNNKRVLIKKESRKIISRIKKFFKKEKNSCFSFEKA